MEKCAHQFGKGKRAGTQCRNAANHGKYCKRHQKGESIDLANDEVFGNGGAKAEPKPAGPKHKFSAFMITINCQKDPAKMSTDEKKRFKHMMEYLFAEENLPRFLKDRTNPADSGANIIKLASEYHAEVGGTQHRLHVHGIIKVEHLGNYILDLEKMRAFAQKVLGYKPHINVIPMADTDAAWAAYMRKNEAAEKVEL
jgi:hypothetical protein